MRFEDGAKNETFGIVILHYTIVSFLYNLDRGQDRLVRTMIYCTSPVVQSRL
jgi:hypothetical protein